MIYLTMTTLRKSAFFVLPFLVLFMLPAFQKTIIQKEIVSPTPTYDPLAEPPLPEHPTEYELGRNLYWHWCMTCHGDRGQGLTDEFRRIWPSDHQNCWAHGCHAGREGDMGFPIPTVVPSLVNTSHLVRFESLQALEDFLRETHPPQSPGILKDDEYHAIALYVFSMNGRSSLDAALTMTPPDADVNTVPAITYQQTATKHSFLFVLIILVGSVCIIFFVWHMKRKED